MKNILIKKLHKKPAKRSIAMSFLKGMVLLCCIISNTAAIAEDCTICTLNKSVNDNHDSLLTMLKLYFVNGLQGVTDTSLNPKPQLDLFDHYKTISDINIVAADTQLATDLSAASSNLVSYYLAGMDVKQQDMASLSIIQAEDTSGASPIVSNYISAINSTTANSGTAVMNMDTLLGPVQYDDTQKTNATNLLRYIENLSPVQDIIRISSSFSIPYKDPTSGASPMKINIAKSGGKTVQQKITDLQNTLESNSIYSQYKTSYRSSVAARTMYVNNLLRFYKERVAPTADKNSKSAAATDYESATWRLRQPADSKSTSYMDDMKNASPATVSREIVFLLAEIHYDLYKMQQQNQQMIALQSLSNLQVNQISNMLNANAAKQVAKLIYCWYDKDQNGGTNKDTSCQTSTDQTGTGTTTNTQAPQTAEEQMNAVTQAANKASGQ